MRLPHSLAYFLIPALLLGVSNAQESKEKPAPKSSSGESSPFDIDPDDDDSEVENEITLLTFLLEWIEVDHRTANKLVRKHTMDKIRADGLREELDELLDQGKATLLETAYMVTSNGQRTKSESVDELIYPTEFDPAEIPQTFDVKGPIDSFPSAPANPTAFDVRNVGVMVEVEPQLDVDGKTISVNIAPEIVSHHGDSYMGAKEAPHKLLAPVKQPNFSVMKVATNLSVRSGDYVLLSIQKSKGEGKEDKRVMLMMRAQVKH